MSPGLNAGFFDSTTSLTVWPHIGSPTSTGAAYDGPSLMRPRMYGSSDRNIVRRRTAPSVTSGIGASTMSKLAEVGAPTGRDFRRIWRFMAMSFQRNGRRERTNVSLLCELCVLGQYVVDHVA